MYPFDAAAPSGLHVLVRQLVEALLAQGQPVRLVLAKPDGLGGMLDGVGRESYPGLKTQLDVSWLPSESFAPEARHQLSFAFERLAEDTARWLCFGVEASAFVGNVVARQAGTPCATVVVARDVLGRLMLHPDEIGATLTRSRHVFCANPGIIDLLRAFFVPEIAALVDQRRLAIVRPTCTASAAVQIDVADHVCTTGVLGLFEDLGELTERVAAEMRATQARRWLHVGTMHPRIAGRLAAALGVRGLAAHFDATGRCGAVDHERYVRSSLVLLKPRGELDTGLSLTEAGRWGLRVSLPAGAADSTDAHGLDELDAVGFATRLLAP
ncbi:MAG: hypothetical protein ABI629_01140 [bacterium]